MDLQPTDWPFGSSYVCRYLCILVLRGDIYSYRLVLNYEYYNMKTQKFDSFLKKIWNWILTCAKELKSFKLPLSTGTYMTTSGMHRRPFYGGHVVFIRICPFLFLFFNLLFLVVVVKFCVFMIRKLCSWRFKLLVHDTKAFLRCKKLSDE